MTRPRNTRRRDHRLISVGLLIALMFVFVILSRVLPSRGVGDGATNRNNATAPDVAADARREAFPKLLAAVDDLTEERAETTPDPRTAPREHAAHMRDAEYADQVKKGVALLEAERYGEAVAPLARAIALRPDTPTPYVNMGYAQLGLGNLDHAELAFTRAIDAKPNEARAYFGLGIVYDRTGDLENAMGAMRSFLHLTKERSPNNDAVMRARSALWEWEAKLGRGPWGPTRGVPPGLTESDLQRDGQGVGMLAPQPDGTSRVQPRPPEHFRAPTAH